MISSDLEIKWVCCGSKCLSLITDFNYKDIGGSFAYNHNLFFGSLIKYEGIFILLMHDFTLQR